LNILKRFISQKIKFDVIILDPPYAFEIKNLFQKLFKIIHKIIHLNKSKVHGWSLNFSQIARMPPNHRFGPQRFISLLSWSFR
ncbi:MAG: hypothetical protein Q8755_03120, partial [Candidatus Phytoplasma australasiaticum]|nr:hypothetical protein [Candidatus Phytoplasma australasiaticum]